MARSQQQAKLLHTAKLPQPSEPMRLPVRKARWVVNRPEVEPNCQHKWTSRTSAQTRKVLPLFSFPFGVRIVNQPTLRRFQVNNIYFLLEVTEQWQTPLQVPAGSISPNSKQYQRMTVANIRGSQPNGRGNLGHPPCLRLYLSPLRAYSGSPQYTPENFG